MRAPASDEHSTVATDDRPEPQGRTAEALGRIARYQARRRRAAQGAVAITGATVGYATPVAHAVRVASAQTVGSPAPVVSPTTPPVSGTATPTRTPTPSPTGVATATSTATGTATTGPSATATNTPTTGPSATPSNTSTPTNTPVPATEVSMAITPGGSAVTLCTTQPNQNGRLTFTATAGQLVSLQVSSVSGLVNAFMTLVRPDLTVQNVGTIGAGGGFFGPLTLSQAGNYAFIIDAAGDSFGCATFQLFTGTDVFAGITIGGAAVTACTTVPGQDIRLLFTASAGQMASLQVSNSNALTGAFVTLIRPNGVTTNIGTIGAGGTFFDTFVMPDPGTYTLRVDASGAATGCATFQLIDVPADVSVAITPGGAPVQACNTAPGQDINLTFSAAAGSRVSMQVTNSTLVGAFVTLIRPNGVITNVGTIGAGTTFFDTQELTLAGAYTFHVDPGGSQVGCATFQAFAVPVDASANLSVGGAAAMVCTTVAGQDINLTFNGTSGQSVSLHVAGGNTIGGSFVTLRRPSSATSNVGTISATGTNFAAVTLNETGTFTFQVDLGGSQVGCATFSLV